MCTASGEKQVAGIAVTDAECVAFFPGGDLLVASSAPGGPIVLQRFGPTGDALRSAVLSPENSRAHLCRWRLRGQNGLARDRHRPDSQLLFSGPLEGAITKATAAELAAAFPLTGLTGESAEGFCLQEMATRRRPSDVAASRGTATRSRRRAFRLAPLPPWQTKGSITSGWIDSRIPRCAGTGSESMPTCRRGPGSKSRTSRPTLIPTDTRAWEPPSPADSQSGPAGRPRPPGKPAPGRYLQLSLTLTGDGTHTPIVRSVRIDFPRRTSLDWLPAVYGENPQAEDFTERFLANFDASIEDVDAAITRFPALLAAAAVPGEVLPWLGSFLDVAFDSEWSDAKRRTILSTLPTLYSQRGTLSGLPRRLPRFSASTQRFVSWQPNGPGALADSTKDESHALVQPAATVGAVRLFGKATVAVSPRAFRPRVRSHTRVRQPRPRPAHRRSIPLRNSAAPRDVRN